MGCKLTLSDTIQRLDEMIFNHKRCVSETYRGTGSILLFPAVTGLIVGLYFTITASGAPEYMIEHIKIFSVPVLFLNELFLMKHVFQLPGFFRKFFYPVFVAVITLLAFSAVCYLTYVLVWVAIGFGILCAFVELLKYAMTAPPPPPPSELKMGIEFCGKSTLSDGTPVTQIGDHKWKSSDGTTYTELMGKVYRD